MFGVTVQNAATSETYQGNLRFTDKDVGATSWLSARHTQCLAIGRALWLIDKSLLDAVSLADIAATETDVRNGNGNE